MHAAATACSVRVSVTVLGTVEKEFGEMSEGAHAYSRPCWQDHPLADPPSCGFRLLLQLRPSNISLSENKKHTGNAMHLIVQPRHKQRPMQRQDRRQTTARDRSVVVEIKLITVKVVTSRFHTEIMRPFPVSRLFMFFPTVGIMLPANAKALCTSTVPCP